MSRIATSVASLSSQSAAIRWASSRGVRWRDVRARVPMGRRIRRAQADVRRSRYRPSRAISRCDGHRDVRDERLAGRRAARAARVDEIGCGGIGKTVIRSGRPSAREHVVERDPLDAGPRADAEAREVEHPLRLLPVEEAGELVGADHEDRVVERERLERVDGAPVRLERDLAPGTSANAISASVSRTSAGVPTSLCPGSATTRTSSRSSANRSIAARRERHVAGVRRVERAAEDARSAHGCHSSSSSPTSTSAPRADAGGAQRLVELLARRRVARRPGSRDRCGSTRNAARRRGCGRYSRNSGRAGASSAVGSGAAGQSANSACTSSAIPCPGRARDPVDGDDPLVGDRERRRLGVQVGLVEDDDLRAAPRARRRRARARGRSRGSGRPRRPPSASITCTSSRARSRWARKSWPSPTPSLAPSISPGTSATVSCAPSGDSTVPSTGCSVVNG